MSIAVKHYIHNLRPKNPFVPEAKVWDWVQQCGAFCYTGNHATPAEIKYIQQNCPPQIEFGASLVTYQHVNGVEPAPTDDAVLNQQLVRIKQRIDLLAAEIPKMSWMFLECELWAGYVKADVYKPVILKRHQAVIDYIRQKMPGVKITFYKYGSTVTSGWWLNLMEETVFTLKEAVDAYSVPFYSPSDATICRRQLDGTLTRAQLQGFRGGVVPWISFGQEHVAIDNNRWDLQAAKYETSHSWVLGQYINKAYYRDPDFGLARGHWGKIPVVYAYRPHTPFFAEHMDAYLAGANA